MTRVEQTTAFRKKWGGVISPSYTEGNDLSSNKFIGTATTQDVINSLINPPKSNRYVGSGSNLQKFLDERNLTPTTAPDNWTAPEKQTVLRAQIAGLSQAALDLPKENPMALYAILIGAGLSGYYLMTRLGKKKGRN